MALTFPLTSEPVAVTTSGFDGGALVLAQNAAVYAIDTGAGTSPGVPVQPGDTLSWPPGRALWLTGDTGAVAVVEPSGANLFPAAGIASQLLTQGLPSQIANSIYTTGIRSVDQPVKLLDASLSYQAGGTLTLTPAGGLDTSEYRSLRVLLSSYANGGSLLPAQDTWEWGITQSDDSVAGLDTETLVIGSHQASLVSLVTPAKGSLLALTAQSDTLSPAAYDVRVTVYGSLREAPAVSYQVNNTVWDSTAGVDSTNGQAESLKVTLNATSTGTWFPSHSTGPKWLTWSVYLNTGANTTGSDVLLQWGNNAANAVGDIVNKSAGTVNSYPPASLGARQPILYVNNRNAAQLGYLISITS